MIETGSRRGTTLADTSDRLSRAVEYVAPTLGDCSDFKEFALICSTKATAILMHRARWAALVVLT